MSTTDIITVALGLVGIWLTCTVMGRYYLRKIGFGLLLIAGGVILVDYGGFI